MRDPTKPRRRRVLAMAVLALAGCVLLGFIAFKVSPWPSVWVTRWVFSRAGTATNEAMGAYTSGSIRQQEALSYDSGDKDAVLDFYRPAALDGMTLPIIVWIHGGGYVAGSRTEISNYARILSGEGFAVATVDYSLAPTHRYPVQLRQVNRALAFLSSNASRLQIDPGRFILGGDSAGAQIASQLAALTTSAEYARSIGLKPALLPEQLRGAVLFCGPHDARTMAARASESWFIHTILWSYFGSPAPPERLLQEFAVVPHVTAAFPPSFITVGNGDPLAPQSVALADALRQKGVRVESAFYPDSYTPSLGHEYQFDLSLPASLDVLRRTRAFLGSLVNN
jgi:acetyl esterase